jgi:hypothetical protein
MMDMSLHKVEAVFVDLTKLDIAHVLHVAIVTETELIKCHLFYRGSSPPVRLVDNADSSATAFIIQRDAEKDLKPIEERDGE